MLKQQLDLFQTVDMSSANEAVLVANTPSFLFERLRKDAAVEYVAKTLKTAEIIDALNQFSKTRLTSPREFVERYVYLVALALKEPHEFTTLIDEINLSDLEWGPQIRELIKASTITTNRVEIGAQGPVLRETLPRTEASSSRIDQQLQPNPEGRIVFP